MTFYLNKPIFPVSFGTENPTSFCSNMARKDDITGKGPQNGYRSSKSNNKTKHRFKQNLQKKKFYIPEQDKWVTLKVSAKTLRTINKNGISAVLKEARKQGTLRKDI